MVRLVGVHVHGSFAGSAGGGIYYDGSAGGSMVVERSTVAGNITNGDDGGSTRDGRVTVTGTPTAGSSIAGNAARNGGGVYNAEGSLGQAGESVVTLTHTTVSGNDALGSGGGVDNRLEGRVSLTDTSISANHAAGDGGGVAISSKASLAVDADELLGEPRRRHRRRCVHQL